MLFYIVTESFSHWSAPALQFYLRTSIWGHLLSVLFVFFPAIHGTFKIDLLLFVDRVNYSFSYASSKMVCASNQTTKIATLFDRVRDVRIARHDLWKSDRENGPAEPVRKCLANARSVTSSPTPFVGVGGDTSFP